MLYYQNGTEIVTIIAQRVKAKQARVVRRLLCTVQHENKKWNLTNRHDFSILRNRTREILMIFLSFSIRTFLCSIFHEPTIRNEVERTYFTLFSSRWKRKEKKTRKQVNGKNGKNSWNASYADVRKPGRKSDNAFRWRIAKPSSVPSQFSGGGMQSSKRFAEN